MWACTAATSEKWNPYACLLAVGRSQLFGVWFWSYTCSLLMEFPWLQSRHNLNRSECKLLSGSHSYWSSRVIITSGLGLRRTEFFYSHWRVNSSEYMWILHFAVSDISSAPVGLTSQAQWQQKVTSCQILNLASMLWYQLSFLVVSWRDKNMTTVWEESSLILTAVSSLGTMDLIKHYYWLVKKINTGPLTRWIGKVGLLLLSDAVFSTLGVGIWQILQS